MLSTSISLSLIALFTAWLFWRRQYLFAVFVLTFSLYEFSAPVLHFILIDDPRILAAGKAFLDDATGSTVQDYCITLSWFLALSSSCYWACAKMYSIQPSRLGHWRERHLSDYYVIIAAMLCFGIVSNIHDAGAVRLLDYLGQEQAGTPVFFYGSALLVVLAVIVIYCVQTARWGTLVLILLAASPLVYELFISSRRQHFAPSLLLILLYILYSREVKRKGLMSVMLIGAVLVLFALQFWVRFQFQGEVRPDDAGGAILAPQFGEFVAIGSTSFASWSRYVIGDDEVTYGVHWLFHLLNTVPFLKLGNLWFPDYAAWLEGTYWQLAPYGGLSMLADSFFGGGLVGLCIFAVACGVLLWFGHSLLVQYLSGRVGISISGTYAVSLIATLLPKYRSGIGDVLQTVVSFTLLFLFFALLGLLLAQLVRSTTGRPRGEFAAGRVAGQS